MVSSLDISEPKNCFSSSFFHEDLLKTKGYSLEPSSCRAKLDQNESPFDWDPELKEEITRKLCQEPWNTYPEDYPRELRKLLADSLGVTTDHLVMSPGSNHHISVLLNLFASGLKGDIVLTRPSFPLFEAHCLYHKISYEVWPLDEKYQYNLELLPPLKPASVVFFASPNNPVGNTLPKEQLRSLLKSHPDCYFVADEAYWEFTEDNFLSLLRDFSNLIILRTFSKAMSSAGVRLSYVVASVAFCKQLEKVTLPFLINKFSSTAAVCALNSSKFMSQIKDQVSFVKQERDRLYKDILPLSSSLGFQILSSQANFLSFICSSPGVLGTIEKAFLERGILLRNVSNPLMANTLRLSVGNSEENTAVINLLKSLVS